MMTANYINWAKEICSDLLYGALRNWDEVGIEELAKRLKVEVQDIHDWIAGDSLPSTKILLRLNRILNPNPHLLENGRSLIWNVAYEHVFSIELEIERQGNIKKQADENEHDIAALAAIKITQPKEDAQ
ncbi:MAG: hypothetical protein FWB71_00810 [Defluviitaleaceae bacterium]|nr:hypothetical protein [Defluviitaleaceae bacterium]